MFSLDRQQPHTRVCASALSKVCRASLHRASLAPVILQSTSTARRMDASARHEDLHRVSSSRSLDARSDSEEEVAVGMLRDSSCRMPSSGWSSLESLPSAGSAADGSA